MNSGSGDDRVFFTNNPENPDSPRFIPGRGYLGLLLLTTRKTQIAPDSFRVEGCYIWPQMGPRFIPGRKLAKINDRAPDFYGFHVVQLYHAGGFYWSYTRIVFAKSRIMQ